MALYSEKVMDHFRNPRNVGQIDDADGVGEVGNAKCGDIMRMYIKVDDGIITQRAPGPRGRKLQRLSAGCSPGNSFPDCPHVKTCHCAEEKPVPPHPGFSAALFLCFPLRRGYLRFETAA